MTSDYVEEGVRVFLEQANTVHVEQYLPQSIIVAAVASGLDNDWETAARFIIGYCDSEIEFHTVSQLIARQVADYRSNCTHEVLEAEKYVHQQACEDHINDGVPMPEHDFFYPVSRSSLWLEQQYAQKLIYGSGVQYRKVSIWDEQGKKVSA